LVRRPLDFSLYPINSVPIVIRKFGTVNRLVRFPTAPDENLSLMNDESKALTWYLAYGSNMNRGIFEIRRGMRPIKAQPALLENYWLRFNLAIGPGERGVGNLESHAGARTWGVLYLITVEQSEHLDRTEGVPRGAYRRIPVRAIVDGREQLAAFTYQSDRISLGRKPSPRYIGLLIEGAVQHGLPPGYLGYLRNFELAADERSSERRNR
jgi:gamma-glutamylcyclotransferase